MLDQNQWQTATNIAIWAIKTATPDHINFIWDNLYWQLGSEAAEEIGYDQVSWLVDHAWRGIQSGQSNEEISAQMIADVSPWLPSHQGAVPESPGGVLTSEQRSAKANLDGFLSQYGLDTLGDFVWQEYLNNIPIEQIMLDIRDRPE